MKRYYFQVIFSATVSVYFLGYKVNWEVLTTALKTVNPWFFLISTLIAVAGSVILALKYKLLMSNSTLKDIPTTRLVVINFIVRFYALFLPSSLSAGTVRWYNVTKNSSEKSFFAVATIIERISFFAVLLIFGTISFLLNNDPRLDHLRTILSPLLYSAFLVTVGILLFIYIPFCKEIITRVMAFYKMRLVIRIIDSMANINISTNVTVRLYLLALLWHAMYLGRVECLALALNLPVSPWDLSWMASMALMLQILPISLGGIGVREGTYAFLFGLQGLDPESGVLLGLLFFSQMMVFSIAGGVLNAYEK